MTDIIKKEVITLPEVKALLETVKPEEMDQIQRWTYDYVVKFSKSDYTRSNQMKKEMIERCDLKEEEAAEVINILPQSLEELRAFTFGWKKLILTENLEKILNI
ncbi:MAG: RNA polymerase Rpb4, partial [Nitrososphaeraceae archaeon]